VSSARIASRVSSRAFQELLYPSTPFDHACATDGEVSDKMSVSVRRQLARFNTSRSNRNRSTSTRRTREPFRRRSVAASPSLFHTYRPSPVEVRSVVRTLTLVDRCATASAEGEGWDAVSTRIMAAATMAIARFIVARP
jgi:hypothetical protein